MAEMKYFGIHYYKFQSESYKYIEIQAKDYDSAIKKTYSRFGGDRKIDIEEIVELTSTKEAISKMETTTEGD